VVVCFEIPFALSVGPKGPKSKDSWRFDSARCAGYAQRERKICKLHHYVPVGWLSSRDGGTVCIANATHEVIAMKSATLPSLRVEPELRRAAEAVLHEGESLSSFMEQSLRDEVNRRRMQAEFIARGLAAREEAKRTGVYYSVEESMSGLDAILARHKPRAS